MSGWPALDYEADKATIESLHLLAQLIGKLPVRLHPWINHGWHVALRMTPRVVTAQHVEHNEIVESIAVNVGEIDAHGGK